LIPSAHRLIVGYQFVARRSRLEPEVNVNALNAALAVAQRLVTTPEDEPAALLFSFARHPEAFPHGWRAMTNVTVKQQAQSLGFQLDARADAIDALCTRVANGEATWLDVQEWVKRRLSPV
jgi:hypothetical protein